MENLLSSYEHQFGQITADVVVKLGLIQKSHGAEKKSHISAAERQLDEAQELLEQMDLEIRDLPNSERGKLMNRAKSYQTEFNNLESKLKKQKLTSLTDPTKLREELLSYDDSESVNQRTRLLDNSQKLENSSRRLDVGYKVALETEQVAQGILDNLHKDRETLTRSSQRLRESNANLSKSSRVVSSMMKRILQNRLMMMFISVFLFVMLIVVIWVKVHKSN